MMNSASIRSYLLWHQNLLPSSYWKYVYSLIEKPNTLSNLCSLCLCPGLRSFALFSGVKPLSLSDGIPVLKDNNYSGYFNPNIRRLNNKIRNRNKDAITEQICSSWAMFVHDSSNMVGCKSPRWPKPKARRLNVNRCLHTILTLIAGCSGILTCLICFIELRP